MKKRIGQLTLLNVLFAMLVIFIHVSSKPLMSLRHEGLPYLVVMVAWRLSSFATQGFIFLSGFKLMYNQVRDGDNQSFLLRPLPPNMIRSRKICASATAVAAT